MAMVVQNIEKIKEQAIGLAKSNKETEPYIQAVYWFPHDSEIRLVEVEEDSPGSEFVEAFLFAPSPADNLDYPSAIAIIRPEEYAKIRLPKGWGRWEDGEKLPV